MITALSEGRGYGEAGGEGLFPPCRISESLTHQSADWFPSRERARALGQRKGAEEAPFEKGEIHLKAWQLSFFISLLD